MQRQYQLHPTATESTAQCHYQLHPTATESTMQRQYQLYRDSIHYSVTVYPLSATKPNTQQQNHSETQRQTFKATVHYTVTISATQQQEYQGFPQK